MRLTLPHSGYQREISFIVVSEPVAASTKFHSYKKKKKIILFYLHSTIVLLVTLLIIHNIAQNQNIHTLLIFLLLL